MTEVISASDIGRAVAALSAGLLVAFPTETVYGLGADASNHEAVRAVFAAKGRPAGHPLIVHLASVAQLDEWAANPDQRARLLAERFWPGPLTLVVPRTERVVAEAVGGRSTVGLRVPDHPLTLGRLRLFGGGVVGPSANRFGHVSPTTAQHVFDDLEGKVDLVLDGGASTVGLESTIVEVLDGPVTMLRPGAVTVDELSDVLGEEVVDGREGASRAAGMLASHYAPQAKVSIIDPLAAADGISAQLGTPGTYVVSAVPFDHPRVIMLGSDAGAFGEGLYAALRAADAEGATHIVIVPPADGSLLPAILDRLMKAVGPRG